MVQTIKQGIEYFSFDTFNKWEKHEKLLST